MHFGMNLRELSRQPIGVALSFLLALFVGISSGYKIGFAPPSLTPRSVDIATASTEVLVDTPQTAVLDLRQGTAELQSMSNRALLIGNVMASLPLREYIARRAHIPADLIKAQTPLTPQYPRPIAGGANTEKTTSDLVRSTHEYRLNIQSNPTVPVLEIYAQAPTAKAAEELANAAVDGMRDYLGDVAGKQAVSSDHQVKLEQLGRASGKVIDHGARTQLVVLVFFFMLALCGAATLFVGRVRRGWVAAGEQPIPTPEGAA
jgi:hypothetical protein